MACLGQIESKQFLYRWFVFNYKYIGWHSEFLYSFIIGSCALYDANMTY